MIKCGMCDKEYDKTVSLIRHICNYHKIKIKEYYDLFIKKKDEGLCLLCGKKTKFVNYKKGYRKYCSSKCSNNSVLTKEKIKSTFMKRYGVEYISQLEEIKNKVKQTNLKKYGYSCSLQNKDIQEKSKQKCLEKYGESSFSKTEEYKNKFKQTCLEKYGVENPIQNKQIQEKRNRSMLKKYGCEYSFQSKEIKLKIKQKLLEKYGYDHNSKIKEIRDRIKQTNLEKYGVENPAQTDEYKKSQKIKFYNQLLINNRIPNLTPLFSLEEYNGVNKENKYKFKCELCGNEFEDHLACGRIPRCLICYPYSVSVLERDIREYIQSIYFNEILFNDRSIIGPKELDIVLPDIKLAIEVNGDYYHTEAFGRGDEYHQNKVDLCESIGYRLIFVWEHDWEENQEEMKRLILEEIIFNNKQ